jgi:hypothetical protein
METEWYWKWEMNDVVNANLLGFHCFSIRKKGKRVRNPENLILKRVANKAIL